MESSKQGGMGNVRQEDHTDSSVSPIPGEDLRKRHGVPVARLEASDGKSNGS
jgi:hypothetical protein